MSSQTYMTEDEVKLAIKQLSIMEMLIEDNSAISIQVHLPGNNTFSYSVENNSFILELLEKERAYIAKQYPLDL